MLGRTPGNIRAVRRSGWRHRDFDHERCSATSSRRAHNRRTLVKPRIIICVPFGHHRSREARRQSERRERRSARGVLIESPWLRPSAPAADHRAERQHDRRHRAARPRSPSSRSPASSTRRAFPRRRRQDGRRISAYLKRSTTSPSASRRPSASRCKSATRTRRKADDVRGQRARSRRGVPKTVIVNSDEIREALDRADQCNRRGGCCCARKHRRSSGRHRRQRRRLTGGGALLFNLDVLLREETGLPVMVCAIRSARSSSEAAKRWDHIELLKEVTIS